LNDNWFDNEKEKYLQVCVGYFSEQRLPSVWRARETTSFLGALQHDSDCFHNFIFALSCVQARCISWTV